MYISINDLYVPEDVLIRLTDDESTGSVNTARADGAISSAQAVVDASLSKQYDVPLASPPQLVIKLTADIALYNLYLRQAIVPAEVKESYTRALETLNNLANGALPLPSSAPGSSFSSSPRD
ncbi:MAG: phage protein Gp36 family protein, partial [Nitrospirota bacterium]